jgi:hypothetical protein
MSDLARFLQATDLDALATYHTALEPLDAIEQEVVIACIVQGINMQAIANLLLYPDVLPDAIRWSTLQRYLNSQRYYPYLTLAAVVGCYHTSPDTLSEAEQAQIAAQLLTLLQESKPLIAAWAGVGDSAVYPADGGNTSGGVSGLPRYHSAAQRPCCLNTGWHPCQPLAFAQSCYPNGGLDDGNPFVSDAVS